MPEMYTGQAEVVAGKLTQLELLQSADEARAKIADTETTIAILDRMASRAGVIASTKRQLAKLEAEPETSRDKTLRFRVTEQEANELHARAEENGQTFSQYVRSKLGI